MKKQMDELTKAKLMYSGELVLIGVVFFVIGLLKFLGFMDSSNETRRLIFHIITLGGGIWLIVNLVWLIISKKKRENDCLLDKILNLPLGLFMISYAIYSFIITKANWDAKSHALMLFIAFSYVFIDYVIQGIYHWFYPLPAFLKAIEEDKKMEEMKKAKEAEDK